MQHGATLSRPKCKTWTDGALDQGAGVLDMRTIALLASISLPFAAAEVDVAVSEKHFGACAMCAYRRGVSASNADDQTSCLASGVHSVISTSLFASVAVTTCPRTRMKGQCSLHLQSMPGSIGWSACLGSISVQLRKWPD